MPSGTFRSRLWVFAARCQRARAPRSQNSAPHSRHQEAIPFTFEHLRDLNSLTSDGGEPFSFGSSLRTAASTEYFKPGTDEKWILPPAAAPLGQKRQEEPLGSSFRV